MTASDARTPRPGLRERKKQRTRETIARVALDLFAERGYEETTLDDIADAAEVAKGTIFSYYPSKEDILFQDEFAVFAELAQALRQRPSGTTTIDVLGDFQAMADPPDAQAKLRRRIIVANDSLRLSERARFGWVEELLAESIALDLDAGPDDIRPLLLAASVTAAFNAGRDRLYRQSGGEIPHEQTLAILRQVFELLRSGLEALQ